MMLGIIIGLMLVVAAQMVAIFRLNRFWADQVQSLVNMMMSRDFVEYTKAIEPAKPRIKVPTDLPEDLGILAPQFDVT